jgi:hypothetical protein
MPIAQSMCSSFKTELFGGIHDMDTDVFKLALYTSAATLGAATTEYTATNEVVAVGYTAGGQDLTGAVISLDGTTAIVDFNDVTWPDITLTARGALIFNSSKANRAVAVLDFGSDKISTDGDFVVQMPAPAAATAILRIA